MKQYFTANPALSQSITTPQRLLSYLLAIFSGINPFRTKILAGKTGSKVHGVWTSCYGGNIEGRAEQLHVDAGQRADVGGVVNVLVISWMNQEARSPSEGGNVEGGVRDRHWLGLFRMLLSPSNIGSRLAHPLAHTERSESRWWSQLRLRLGFPPPYFLPLIVTFQFLPFPSPLTCSY